MEHEDLGVVEVHPPPDVASIFEDHRLRFLRMAVLLVGDQATAEDIVQDAFAGLQRKWADLRDEGKAVAYVRVAVVNGCRSVLRRRTVARRFVSPVEPPVWSAESDVILKEDRREVLRALHRLPRRRREVLVMRYYLDLDYAEIAQTLNIREVTVRTTVARALEALGRLIEEEK